MNIDQKNKAMELTDEQVEKAAGGASYLTFTCQKCGRQNTVEIVNWGVQPPCVYCGFVNVYTDNPHGGR